MFTFSYYKDGDYERVRQLILDSRAQTGPIAQVWSLDRLNFSVFSQHIHQTTGTWRRTAGLWSDTSGRLVAMAMDEGETRGEAYMHFLDPTQTVSAELLADMFFFIETHLRPDEDNQQLFLRIPQQLTAVKEMAAKRSFKNSGRLERSMALRLNDQPFEVALPTGFIIRSGEDITDAERAICHQHAFDYGWPYSQYTEQCFYLLRQAPDYQPKLDLCIFDTNGRPAAYAHFWYDEQNEFGMLEPLATVKWHHRQGLGRALIYEGANRLRQLGKCSGMLAGDQPFYTALGFECIGVAEIWAKKMN